MFVDDANLIHSTSYNTTTVEKLRNFFQDDINAWNDGLTTSGGHLNSSKTRFYILNWLFHKNGAPYLDTTVERTPPITILNNGQPEHILQIHPDQDQK